MKNANCALEAAVQRAVHSNLWPESLQAHAAACDSCREVVKTSIWMQALAHPAERAFPSRDASLLWWRAQLCERRIAAERVRKTLEWIEIAFVAVAAAASATWLTWNPQFLQATVGWIGSISPEAWTEGYSVAGSTPIPLWSIFLLLSAAAAFIIYPTLIEE